MLLLLLLLLLLLPLPLPLLLLLLLIITAAVTVAPGVLGAHERLQQAGLPGGGGPADDLTIIINK